LMVDLLDAEKVVEKVVKMDTGWDEKEVAAKGLMTAVC